VNPDGASALFAEAAVRQSLEGLVKSASLQRLPVEGLAFKQNELSRTSIAHIGAFLLKAEAPVVAPRGDGAFEYRQKTNLDVHFVFEFGDLCIEAFMIPQFADDLIIDQKGDMTELRAKLVIGNVECSCHTGEPLSLYFPK
jgi:hypothetical protein